jgi:hypothetical protein
MNPPNDEFEWKSFVMDSSPLQANQIIQSAGRYLS